MLGSIIVQSDHRTNLGSIIVQSDRCPNVLLLIVTRYMKTTLTAKILILRKTTTNIKMNAKLNRMDAIDTIGRM